MSNTNPFAIENIEAAERSLYRGNIIAAVETDPESAAKAVSLSRKTGIPYEAVLSNLPDVQNRNRQKETFSWVEGKPITQQFLMERKNADIAHDDLENMGILETLWNSARRGIPAALSAIPSIEVFNQARDLNRYKEIDAQIAAGGDPISVLERNGLSDLFDDTMTPEEAIAAWQGYKSSAIPLIEGQQTENITRLGELHKERNSIPLPAVVGDVMNEKTFSGALGKIMESPGTFIAGIGPESFIQSAPGMLLAVPSGMAAGPAGAAGAIGVNSFAVDYASQLMEGLQRAGVDIGDPDAVREALRNPEMLSQITSQALRHAVIVGAFDAASGGLASKVLLPSPIVSRLASRPFATTMANIVVQAPAQGVLGMAGEAGGQLAAGQELQPGEILAEGFGELFGTPGEVVSASAGKIKQQIQAARQAKANAEVIQQVNEAAENSKIRERDPETYREFVEAVSEDAPIQTVYLDARTLEQSGIVEQLTAASPSVADQYAEAIQTGGDISIPIAEYTANIAGTELGQALLEHIRTEPDGMSLSEANEFDQNFDQEIKQEVERVLSEKESDAFFRESADVVRQNIRAQLDQAGRFTGPVNAAYADLVSNFYSVQAARLGIMPDALFQQYPLNINAESILGKHVFSQFIGERGAASLDAKLGISKRLDNLAVAEKMGEAGMSLKKIKLATGWERGADGKWRYEIDDSRVRIKTPTLGRALAKDVIYHPELFSAYPEMGNIEIVFSKPDDSNGAYIPALDSIEVDPGLSRKQKRSVLLHELQHAIQVQEGFSAGTSPDDTSSFESFAERFREDVERLPAYRSLDTDAKRKNFLRKYTISRLSSGEYASYYAYHTSSGEVEARNVQSRERLSKKERARLPAEFTEDVPRIEQHHPDGYPALHQNARNDVVSTLSGDEIVAAEDNDLLTAVRQYFKDNLQGTIVHRPEIGDVRITGKGWQKSKRGLKGNETKAKLLPAIPAIIQNGEYSGRVELNKPRADDIVAFHYFTGGVQLGNDVLSARVVVGEDSFGNLFYDIGESKPEKTKGSSFTEEKALGPEPLPDIENDILEQSIDNADDGVNLLILNKITRGTFNPDTSTISLLKDADLSTFLHETGHFFLETQFSLSSMENAPEPIQQDSQTILDWFGIEYMDTWNSMTFEEKRQYHEKFAEGFEKYLFEGRAPSTSMQGVFQRFRAWLLTVYRDIRNLGVDLTDEVRGVFDRMLASTEEIEFAQRGRGMIPIFENAEQAGMTQEEFEEYRNMDITASSDAIQNLQARSLRDMAFLHNAHSKEVKRIKAEHRERRKDVRRDVQKEVDSMPIYQAWHALREKEGVRLSLQSLQEMYGEKESWVRLRDLRMTANDGVTPDVLAEQFGFSSGDELVKRLMSTEAPRDVIEAMTDERMLQQYGELPNDEAISRAADEVIHNVVRTRFIATEVNALANLTGGRRILTEAARGYAREVVGRNRVRDIKPSQYANAESRAAKAAEKARKSGDLQTAAIEKRNQLIQNLATRAAHEAREDIEKGLRYLRKFSREGVRKNIDSEYRDQIDQMLNRFDLSRSLTQKESDSRTTLAQWIESQRNMGMEPDLSPDIMDEAFRKPYLNMTVEEFRGLVDAVKLIEHIGRKKDSLLKGEVKRRVSESIVQASQSIVDNAGKLRPVDLEARQGITPWLEGISAGHRKLASLFRQMDGGKDNGIMWDLFSRTMNDAATKEAVMIEQATMHLTKLYEPVLALKGGLNGDKRFIPAIGNSLSRAARLSVALNWGNEGNRQRIMSGDGWTQAQVEAILGTLTPVEAKFVNNVWELIDSYWPEIAEKEARITGAAPEKVEAQPFSMQLADGSVAQMRGGYYPIKYDSSRSLASEANQAKEVANEMKRGAVTRATTRRGHTKARQENVSIPVRKSLDVITQHISQVVHDLAWHEWLIDTNRLLDHRRNLSGTIRDYYGPAVMKTIYDNISAIATADTVPQTAMDKAMLYLRASVSRSTMGLSLTTALMQPFGLTQSMVRIGPKHVLRGMARWAGDASRMESSMKWIQEKSDFMRLRAKTFNRELHEINGRVSQGKSKARQVADAAMFMLMQKMQLVADIPTWIGAYEKSLAQGNSDATSIALADQAVLDSQGGGQTKDLSELQRKHPFLSMFYSYFNVTYNLAAESTAKTDFKNPMSVAGWMSDMALLMVIPAIGPSLLIELLRGGGADDAEGWAKKLLEWQVSYLFGTMLGLRELSGVASGFDYTGPPIGQVIAALSSLKKQVQQGELDEALALSAIRLFGAVTGLPAVQIVRSWRGWNSWQDDDAPATSILFGPPPRD